MDRSQKHPWIQVIGRIAVHRPGRETREPKGASRVLLSILVAAGPDGASIEEIAGAYWNQSRPTSWKIALRVSASHLSTQLPDGWDVVVRDGRFRLAPGDGFIDVWRVEECAGDPNADIAGWLHAGEPFADVTDVDIVDAASARIAPLISELLAQAAHVRSSQPEMAVPGIESEQGRSIMSKRRAIVLDSPERHGLIAQAAAQDDVTESHMVVGDRRLLLPLGPFAMTFPELRNEIRLEQGVVEPGSAASAFRVVAETLAIQAAYCPQRLVLANAHELDTKSLKLASLLIERGRLSDFSMIVCGDKSYRDLRWLDFVNRSVTAGCELIEPLSD